MMNLMPHSGGEGKGRGLQPLGRGQCLLRSGLCCGPLYTVTVSQHTKSLTAKARLSCKLMRMLSYSHKGPWLAGMQSPCLCARQESILTLEAAEIFKSASWLVPKLRGLSSRGPSFMLRQVHGRECKEALNRLYSAASLRDQAQ